MRLVLLCALSLAGCSAEPASSNAAGTENAAAVANSADAAANDASANVVEAPAPAALTGTRAERIAQVFRGVIAASGTRGWDEVQAAFPGARWQPRERMNPPNGDGSDVLLVGAIDMAGENYEIMLTGRRQAVDTITFSAPEGTTVERAPIRSALSALGVTQQTVGCIGMMLHVVRLTSAGRSLVFEDGVNEGSMVEPSDYYTFDFVNERATDELDHDCE